MWLINRIWRVLSSRDVAITLLFIITFMLILGSILPNPNFMSPSELARLKEKGPFIYNLATHLNTQSIARGYLFGFLGVFLIISTTACSIDRLLERHKTKKIPLGEIPIKVFDIKKEVDDPDKVLSRIRRHLRLRRWMLREGGSNERRIILAEKGRMGFWGSILFHGILITLLIGLVVYYFTGYRATILITEGQTKRLTEGEIEKVERKPLWGNVLPPLEMTLKKFVPVYWKKTEPVDYSGYFLMRDLSSGKQWEEVMKINAPFRYGGVEFLMIMYGYSPNFVIYRNGEVVFDAYVALRGASGEEDSFNVMSEHLLVKTIFFPDVRIDERGYYTSASPLPRNPLFLIKIQDPSGRTIFKGPVRLGEEKVFGQYRLAFKDIRYWITLKIVKETGIGFFFWCGFIGLLGILMRFIDPDRKILLVFEGNSLSVVSYTRHFEGILKEETTRLISKVTTG